MPLYKEVSVKEVMSDREAARQEDEGQVSGLDGGARSVILQDIAASPLPPAISQLGVPVCWEREILERHHRRRRRSFSSREPERRRSKQ